MISLTQEYIKERLSYDPLTGVFIWRSKAVIGIGRSNNSNWNSRFSGKVAGTDQLMKKKIYRVITVNNNHYLAHRLAWVYVNGVWPNNEIDHIDGNSSNNCISNLRDITSAQNKQNIFSATAHSKHGMLGVRVRKDGKFTSTIKVDGKSIFLGVFCDKENAKEAYLDAKSKYHPFATISRRELKGK